MGAFDWNPIASIGSSLIGGLFGASGAKSQNAANQAAAQAQMDFQRESAQNQYQWAMEDMRKAGLNPILAYKQGGSGTLSGSTYSATNVGEAAGAGGARAAGTAMQLQRLNADIKNIEAQENTTRESGRSLKLENDLKARYYEGEWGQKLYNQQNTAAASNKGGIIGNIMSVMKEALRPDTSARTLNYNRGQVFKTLPPPKSKWLRQNLKKKGYYN